MAEPSDIANVPPPEGIEPGRNINKGTLHVMWGGVWVPLGDAEFLTDENNLIVKVISFTPRPFNAGP